MADEALTEAGAAGAGVSAGAGGEGAGAAADAQGGEGRTRAAVGGVAAEAAGVSAGAGGEGAAEAAGAGDAVEARLQALEAQIAACRRCELCEGRTQTVFGAGNPHARVMIIGEAPGKNEDAQGVPFVGAAGKFLSELLAHAGLERGDVFIANVLKCRPPSNRNPRAHEIQECAPYLREQTRIISPEIIVTLGNFATKFILKTDAGITELRGRVIEAGRFKVLPIFHPAAALYDRKKRDFLVEDFRALGRMLGTVDKGAASECGLPAGFERACGEGAPAGQAEPSPAVDAVGQAEPSPKTATAGQAKLSPSAEGAAEADADSDASVGFDAVAFINTPRWQKCSLGLDRTRALMVALGNPEAGLKFVHVAGTNGKGSTCAYVESVLRAAGYKTGLFTSPYIVTFEERIRVCGQNISAADLTRATLQVKAAAAAVEAEFGEHPTEFELMFAVAMVYFAQADVDIVVCEVGLGGRLDATNVIAPEVCAITSVSLDHTAILGNTLEAIAHEKAGIIKAGVPCVVYPQDAAAQQVIERAAADVGASYVPLELGKLTVGTLDLQAGVRHFKYEGTSYTTGLLGDYQPKNAALAIEVVCQLCALGWKIDNAAVKRGIAQAAWPGRFEIVRTNPLVIIDGAHNAQGAGVLASSLSEIVERRPAVTFVMGVLADKDYAQIVAAVLPYAAKFVLYAPDNPRALAAADLAAEVERQASALPAGAALEVICEQSAAFAIKRAVDEAALGDVIVACGTLYAIGDIKRQLG